MSTYKSASGAIVETPRVLDPIRSGRDKLHNDDFAFIKTNMNPNKVAQNDTVAVLEVGYGQNFVVGEKFVVVSLVDGRAFRSDGNSLPLSCLKKANEVQKVESTGVRANRAVQIDGYQVVGNRARA